MNRLKTKTLLPTKNSLFETCGMIRDNPTLLLNQLDIIEIAFKFVANKHFF